MNLADSLSEIVKNYRVIFFDAYGVVKNFTGLLDGVVPLLRQLNSEKIPFFILTNDASRSPSLLSEYYIDKDGASLVPEENIISSGLLAHEFIRAKVPQGQIAYLGKSQSEFYIRTDVHQPIPIAEVVDPTKLVAFAMLDDEGFDWNHDINKSLNILRHFNIPSIIANPDWTFPVGLSHLAMAIGGIGEIMERICGKTFLRFGKPDAQVFTYAYSKAKQRISDLQKSEILMIGDTLDTDILGANKFGIHSALVLTGNTMPEEYQRAIEQKGIQPDYVLKSL